MVSGSKRKYSRGIAKAKHDGGSCARNVIFVVKDVGDCCGDRSCDGLRDYDCCSIIDCVVTRRFFHA